MKKLLSIVLALAMCAAIVVGAASCKKKTPAETPADPVQTTDAATQQNAAGLWANATYTEDSEIGEGATTFTVKVTAENKTVTFTVKTDKETVGAALSELGLIDKGTETYYTIVNGITADYNTDQSYWAFYLGSDYASTGLDETNIDPATEYSLVYTK